MIIFICLAVIASVFGFILFANKLMSNDTKQDLSTNSDDNSTLIPVQHYDAESSHVHCVSHSHYRSSNISLPVGLYDPSDEDCSAQRCFSSVQDHS
jgi:hypothetical protein